MNTQTLAASVMEKAKAVPAPMVTRPGQPTDTLFTAQTAKARQVRMEALARTDPNIRELLTERDALLDVVSDLNKKIKILEDLAAKKG